MAVSGISETRRLTFRLGSIHPCARSLDIVNKRGTKNYENKRK